MKKENFNTEGLIDKDSNEDDSNEDDFPESHEYSGNDTNERDSNKEDSNEEDLNEEDSKREDQEELKDTKTDEKMQRTLLDQILRKNRKLEKDGP